MTAADALRTPGLAQALTDGAAALDQVPQLEATVAGLQASLTAAAAQITDLQAQLAAEQPPTTVFGVDAQPATGGTFTQAVAAQRSLFAGVLPYLRVFSPGTILAWGKGDMAAVTTADRPVPSFKKYDPATFNTFMGGIPADLDEVWVSYFHEPEDNAKASGNVAAWIANYLSVYAQMDAARKAHPNGHKVRLVKILMRYQEVNVRKAGCTYKEFHGGQAFVDAIGWDCYAASWDTVRTAADMLDPVVQCSLDTGLPWCVPELGVEDAALRATLVPDVIAYARQHGALWVNYWNANQWDLRTTPAVLAGWREAVG